MTDSSEKMIQEDAAAGGVSSAAASPVSSNVTSGVKNPEKPMGHVRRRKKQSEEYEHAGDIDNAIKAAAKRKLNEVSRWNSQSRSWLGGGWDEGHPDADPHKAADIATQHRDYARANAPWKPPAGYKPMPVRRVYFDVPYEIKDYAKRQGLKWDPDARKWYTDARHSQNKQHDLFGLQTVDDKGKPVGHPKKKVYVQVDKGEEQRAKLQGFRKDNHGWWTLMKDIFADATVSGFRVVK